MFSLWMAYAAALGGILIALYFGFRTERERKKARLSHN